MKRMHLGDYHSFLIRLWRRERHSDGEWLLVLENPHTGERHHFDGLAALTAFLDRLMEGEPPERDVPSVQDE